MDTITKFLVERPLISVCGLEKQCSISHGTIRKNGSRDIPKKFVPILENALEAYGYRSNELLKTIYDKCSEIAMIVKPIIKNDKPDLY